MKTSTLVTIIVASSLLVAGIIIGFVGLTIIGFDWKKLSTYTIVVNTHEISDAFDKIHVDTDTTDVSFVLSEDGQCKVVCEENEKATHIAAVREGVLTVTLTDERKWYDFIGINIDRTSITVYLPEATYASLSAETNTGDIELSESLSFGNVTLSADTGDIICYASVTGKLDAETNTGHIKIENVSVGSMDLEVNTGKVKLSHVSCTHITAQTDTGDMTLIDVTAGETMRLTADTGDVTFDGCDAAEIHVKTSTGDISGTLRSEKIFFAESSTGKVDVPKSMNGGKCEMSTSTGDIHITVVE